ncbi:MAG: 50S ribosomal protein L31 [Proteobacteria bacterium]|nr:50S ribosomal protein L31 [Pseudomonadota bacterium]
MKDKIHPRWFKTEARCGCGNAFVTYSTRPTLTVEICSNCHPFYTGKQRFSSSREGQVEKFNQRLQKKAAGKA